VLDDPEISDKQYDKLIRELEALERAHPKMRSKSSPTRRVGGQPLDTFKKVRHRHPMLSLANAFTVADVRAFDIRLKRFLRTSEEIEYVVEYKLDGLAVELVYEKGELKVGATRGDGTVGENYDAQLLG